ncbi:hypothetical protein C8R43DRAFT_944841 [Mycena crocata]|nr:hypothetical protein C8R43DRAFT_944841 [Mycena crocata]
MPPGRLPLDPDIKPVHRKATLNRYAVKHSPALRASAILRMRRYRALLQPKFMPRSTAHSLRAQQPRSEEQIQAKKEAAARYRQKNREEIRLKDREYRHKQVVAARPPIPTALDTPCVYGIYGVQAHDLVADKRPTTPHRPPRQVISNAERSRRQLEAAETSGPTVSALEKPAPRQPKPLNIDEYILVDMAAQELERCWRWGDLQRGERHADMIFHAADELDSDDDDEVPALVSEKDHATLELVAIKRAELRAKL